MDTEDKERTPKETENKEEVTDNSVEGTKKAKFVNETEEETEREKTG